MYNKSSDTITHSIGYQHVYNGPGEGGGGGKTLGASKGDIRRGKKRGKNERNTAITYLRVSLKGHSKTCPEILIVKLLS